MTTASPEVGPAKAGPAKAGVPLGGGVAAQWRALRDALDNIHVTTMQARMGIAWPPGTTNGGPSARTSRRRNRMAERHVAR